MLGAPARLLCQSTIEKIWDTSRHLGFGRFGNVMGQSIVLLLLVTPKITLPGGFSFYQPDPAIKAWVKENKRLKSIGVLKKDCPKAPLRDPKYPTKQDVALSLLKQFGDNFPEIHVQCILADALYGDKKFMKQASSCFGCVQVIS